MEIEAAVPLPYLECRKAKQTAIAVRIHLVFCNSMNYRALEVIFHLPCGDLRPYIEQISEPADVHGGE
jgi:hypothetical protein